MTLGKVREFVSETHGFWLRAVTLVVLYGVAEVAGLRQYATVLSGTAVHSNWDVSVIVCLIYLTLYFGAIVVAPILVLAAFIFRALSSGAAATRALTRH
jgi:hypothetical protein